jgi:hypothetical protein
MRSNLSYCSREFSQRYIKNSSLISSWKLKSKNTRQIELPFRVNADRDLHLAPAIVSGQVVITYVHSLNHPLTTDSFTPLTRLASVDSPVALNNAQSVRKYVDVHPAPPQSNRYRAHMSNWPRIRLMRVLLTVKRFQYPWSDSHYSSYWGCIAVTVTLPVRTVWSVFICCHSVFI